MACDSFEMATLAAREAQLEPGSCACRKIAEELAGSLKQLCGVKFPGEWYWGEHTNAHGIHITISFQTCRAPQIQPGTCEVCTPVPGTPGQAPQAQPGTPGLGTPAPAVQPAIYGEARQAPQGPPGTSGAGTGEAHQAPTRKRSAEAVSTATPMHSRVLGQPQNTQDQDPRTETIIQSLQGTWRSESPRARIFVQKNQVEIFPYPETLVLEDIKSEFMGLGQHKLEINRIPVNHKKLKKVVWKHKKTANENFQITWIRD